jgi:hypothetical protein
LTTISVLFTEGRSCDGRGWERGEVETSMKVLSTEVILTGATSAYRMSLVAVLTDGRPSCSSTKHLVRPDGQMSWAGTRLRINTRSFADIPVLTPPFFRAPPTTWSNIAATLRSGCGGAISE